MIKKKKTVKLKAANITVTWPANDYEAKRDVQAMFSAQDLVCLIYELDQELRGLQKYGACKHSGTDMRELAPLMAQEWATEPVVRTEAEIAKREGANIAVDAVREMLYELMAEHSVLKLVTEG